MVFVSLDLDMAQAPQFGLQLSEGLRLTLTQHLVGDDGATDEDLPAVVFQEDVPFVHFRGIGLALVVLILAVGLGEGLVDLLQDVPRVPAQIAFDEGVAFDVLVFQDPFPVALEKVRREDDDRLPVVGADGRMQTAFPLEEADGVAVRIRPVAALEGRVTVQVPVPAGGTDVLVLCGHRETGRTGALHEGSELRLEGFLLGGERREVR